MAITAAPETDTPVDVLAAMRGSRAVADREEARILDLAATWARGTRRTRCRATTALRCSATAWSGSRRVRGFWRAVSRIVAASKQ